jgi:hypothetical protein
MLKRKSMLTFDELTHVYTYDGKIIEAHITKMLTALGYVDYSFLNEEKREWYMRRGTAFHQAAHFFDEGDLNEKSLDETTKGYLKSYKAAKKFYGFKWKLIETPMYHPILNYCGRLDRFGTMKNEDLLWVIELKPAHRAKWHDLQLALQQRLIEVQNFGYPGLIQRAGLYLDGKGGFKLHPFNDRQDLVEADAIAIDYYAHARRGLFRENGLPPELFDMFD